MSINIESLVYKPEVDLQNKYRSLLAHYGNEFIQAEVPKIDLRKRFLS